MASVGRRRPNRGRRAASQQGSLGEKLEPKQEEEGIRVGEVAERDRGDSRHRRVVDK